MIRSSASASLMAASAPPRPFLTADPDLEMKRRAQEPGRLSLGVCFGTEVSSIEVSEGPTTQLSTQNLRRPNAF
ncbi:hypothetical protein G6O67_004573 [Ophiocordyceps sinensis]|uniref:Uncharacterized protein n=1 Tax=Ophiocordyceps sinensis TaxID=72228 RepID=A0A8H4V4M6_9HYPO|nr:hypothetical protein G6O67_004573 [Ophiocordyceps sinensis]